MKKYLLGLLALPLGFAGMKAQTVDYYRFSADTAGATYTPLTNPVVLAKSTSVKGVGFHQTLFNDTESLYFTYNGEDTAMTGINIGFDFDFHGRSYNQFIAGGVGYILLGNKADGKIAFPSTNQIAYYQNVYPRIGVGQQKGTYGIDGTQIAYKLEGTAPNQVLTVEFSGMAHEAEASFGSAFNYQIKLYEADSKIEMIFDGYTLPGTVGNWAVGLSGGGPKATNYRKPQDGNWGMTTRVENDRGVGQVGGSCFKEGLKYTFALPPACEAPTEKIKTIRFTALSDQVIIDAEVDTTGHAEGYLVVASSEPITGNPDGKMWSQIGEEALGGTVLAVGPLSDFDAPTGANNFSTPVHFSFVHENLTPNTTCYYAVYLYNYACSDGPKYTVAVTGQAITRTTGVNGLQMDKWSLEEVVFSVTPNEAAEEIVIVMTKQHKYRFAGISGNAVYEGNFGIADSDVQAGDTYKVPVESSKGVISDTSVTIVLYTGPAKENIVCPIALDENTIYYFGAASKGEDGRYSSLWANKAVLSPASIPFEDDFSQMLRADGNSFLGWNGTYGFELAQEVEGSIVRNYAKVSFSRSFGDPQESCLTLPPLDFPTDSNVFFGVDYVLAPWDIGFSEKDSIVFEISKDNGKSFERISAVHYQSNTKEIPGVILKDYAGLKQGILRFRVVSYNTESWECKVDGVSVIGVTCDIPRNLEMVKDNTLGGNVFVQWEESEDKEQEWQIGYAHFADESLGEWSQTKMVARPEYWLHDLGSNEVYKVRVRAVCSPGNYSQWTETEVRSGRIPSYIESFDGMQPGIGMEFTPPTFRPYRLSDYFFTEMYASVEAGVYSPSYHYEDVRVLEWKEVFEGGYYDKALAWPMDNLSILEGDPEVFGLPAVELVPEENPQLTFNMAYGKADADGYYYAVTGPVSGHRVELWVSVDSGRTFDAENPVRVWDSEELAAMDGEDPITIDLSAYKGWVSLVFAFFGESSADENDWQGEILWMNDVGIVNGCPVAKNLQWEYLSDTEAHISWLADDFLMEPWIVKLESPTETRLVEEWFGTCTFEDLTPQTLYKVSVSHLCGEDTAAWQSVSFTTGGADCAPVTEVGIRDLTSVSAKAVWKGEASSYNVRIRPVSTIPAEWTVYQVDKTECSFISLKPETEYEGGVQAVCGHAAGDTSEYVDFAPFTTVVTTCFAPYNLLVEGTPTHNSASFTWDGTAGSYQLEWRLRDSEETLGRMMATDKKGTVTGLEAQTDYEIRVRGVCSDGDTSIWSEIRNFSTGEIPACPRPTGLQVEKITDSSARLLWMAEEDVNDFVLRYRVSTVYDWMFAGGLTETHFDLTGLEPQTAYLWSVRTVCSETDSSAWGDQNRFTTAGSVGTGVWKENGLYLKATRYQLYLMNPAAVQIERVRIFGATGRLLESYTLRSDGNAILTTRVSMQPVIVEVLTSGGRMLHYKILLP